MKKIIVILCFIMILSLVGCKGSNSDNNEVKIDNGDVEDEKNSDREIEEISKKNPASNVKLEGFKMKDIEGNEIDASIFENKDLTVVNLWGTFCPPCIDEIPIFNEISEKYKDKDVQVVGFIVNYMKGDEKDVDRIGVEYKTLIPDAKINEDLVMLFDYVPVTLFVDSDGVVLSKFIPGATNKQQLTNIIEDILKSK
jgi:thiol-disulfide isomerase/thioredoxin